MITEKNLEQGSVALLAVEVFCNEGELLKEGDEKALMAASQVLESCILPDKDLLLPRIGRGARGETFFIVAFADRKGADVVSSRLKEQLEKCEELEAAGLKSRISVTGVGVGSGEDSAARLVEDLSARIDEQTGTERGESRTSR